MKLRHLLLASLLIFSIVPTVGAQGKSPEGVQDGRREALERYMWRFPQSQLVDVYKYCFQDVFGLEHLLNDSLGAVRYIENELAQSDTFDWQMPLFFYPTMGGHYVRVDINYIRMGVIPLGTMVSAMLQSRALNDIGSAAYLEEWKAEWGAICRTLDGIRPRPLNFEADSMRISDMLSAGRYALHHSALFNKTYHQHYRIIRRDIFEKMLLPLIEKSNH